MFDQIAERKIVEAIARGELDGLPGEGRPLDLGDDALVPEELRLAYRILKNAGFVPPDLPVHSLHQLESLVRRELGASASRAARWRSSAR